MLNEDQGRQLVQDAMVSTWQRQRMERFEKSSLRSGKYVRSLVEYDFSDGDGHRAAITALARDLSDLDKQQRAELFALWSPKLVETMEATWHSLRNRPVSSVRYGHTPFRAPTDATAVSQERARWLFGLSHDLRSLDEDAIWLANHSAFLDGCGGSGLDAAWLLAGAIDQGDDNGRRVLNTLIDVAYARHDISPPNLYALIALANCSNPEGWEALERLLVTAQREEGLRQWVLDASFGGHPGALRRILGVILEQDLARFSSVVNAVNEGLNLAWDAVSRKVIEYSIERIVKYMDDEGARTRALSATNGEDVYFALWAKGIEDVVPAAAEARALLGDKKPERRWVAIKVLEDAERFEGPSLVKAVSDEDLRVARVPVVEIIPGLEDELSVGDREPLFNALEELYKRLKGKPQKFKPIVWPWTGGALSPQEITAAMRAALPDSAIERFLPYIAALAPYERARVVETIGGLPRHFSWSRPDDDYAAAASKPLSAERRAALLRLLGDASKDVREAAFKVMKRRPLEADERALVESMLERKGSDLRMLCIARLLSQPDEELLASIGRLGAAKKTEQRIAAVELLQEMVKAGRSVDRAAEVAGELARGKHEFSGEQLKALQSIRGREQAAKFSLEDCFGLVDPAKQTKLPMLRSLPAPELTPAAWGILYRLDGLIEQHREHEFKGEDRSEVVRLGDAHWELDDPKPRENSLDQDKARLVLADAWIGFWENRPPDLRDTDGLELARAVVAHGLLGRAWPEITWPDSLLAEFRAVKSDKKANLKAQLKSSASDARSSPRPTTKVKHPLQLGWLLTWLLRLYPPSGWASLVLDGAEGAGAAGRIVDDRTQVIKEAKAGGREMQHPQLPMCYWMHMYNTMRRWSTETPGPDHGRYLLLSLSFRAKVEGWKEKPGEWTPWYDAERAGYVGPEEEHRVQLEPDWESFDDYLVGAAQGLINEHDLIRRAIPRAMEESRDCDLEYLCHRRNIQKHDKDGCLDRIARKCRDRVLEIELSRGDATTPATLCALAIKDTGGMNACIQAMARLGKSGFSRRILYAGESRSVVFSHTIKSSRPFEGESPEQFAAAAKAAGVAESTMVAAGVLAPQWAAHIEKTIDWAGYEEAVWWIHAHTRTDDWQTETDIREAWDARIAEHTPLTDDELSDGAVDGPWFLRVHQTLGKKRWDTVYEWAKLACTNAGHKRAQLFADAMLNKETEGGLIRQIESKRSQDRIRALGIVPVKAGEAGRKQVRHRYEVMQEIRRTSRKHGGSMLQASEKRAVEIGLENLARTAGYPDPLRLAWALETEAVADLAKGPMFVTVGKKNKAATVTLAVDDDGVAEITCVRGEKVIKSVPPDVKKDKNVAELFERLAGLRKSASRMKQSLEEAMCRGDEFLASELRELWSHPVLRPRLARLVFVGAEEAGGKSAPMLMGYPDKDARVLRDCEGKIEPLKGSDRLRLAHALDLLRTKKWDKWQRDCFQSERVQPFKQIFRELYVPSAKEGPEATETTRYSGHQVQPRQALALLGTRGWITRSEEGVQKTFYKEKITARTHFDEYCFTPADVEGLTLNALSFHRAGKWEALKFKDVPPRVFSECMRDMDLVVSVAHRGGVDPEASESTVEMRGSLLRETCKLLEIANVTVKGSHATIRGQRSDYSLHLGSGTIHLMPGGALWIVPIHSQHRGRLFLPFADDDPKTAEVISKAILLARDSEIRDPSISEQITARAKGP